MTLRSACAFLFGLMVVTPATAQSNPAYPLVIGFPDGKLHVSIDLSGFAVEQNGVQPDGRYYLMANQVSPGRVLSIYLERVPGSADLNGCRESIQQKAEKFKSMAQDIRTWESGETAFLEMMINEAQGMPVHQKSLFACVPRGDTYVDIHISKALYQPQDEAGIQSLYSSIRILNPSDLQVQDDDFREGTKYFVQHDLPKAIEYYAKVLQREKEHSFLNQTTLRVVIDNLGMAYGMSGDLKQAKEVVEYGIGRDTTYPLFYYSLACTYAEMDDLKRVEDNLTSAFHYRDNLISGEAMPDPREDSSFQRFMKNEAFRKFLVDLTGPRK